MEYTPIEREALELFERTDFKNITKNELVSFTTKLNEMRPEVARAAIAQFPELAKLLTSTATEYRGVLEKIINSDDESLHQEYEVLNKDLDMADASRKEYNQMAAVVLDGLNRGLDNPNLSEEERRKIREQQMEVLRMVSEKDTEIREQEKDIVSTADKKDSEKRMFNWKALGTASAVVLAIVGVGAAALGGNFNLKLPKK